MACCGVGYYHDNSLHVDTGPVRYWDETTSKVYTNISEHNKQIMARTDLDIYLPGETVELRLARIQIIQLTCVWVCRYSRRQEPKAFAFDGKEETCLPVKSLISGRSSGRSRPISGLREGPVPFAPLRPSVPGNAGTDSFESH